MEAPVLYICENNKYGMSMDAEKCPKLPLAQRADAYGMPFASTVTMF
jgi:TPP-dependent pyruvate/acetoin dehydrogenase alpha subunit